MLNEREAWDKFILLRPSGCDECAIDDDTCMDDRKHELGTTCQTERVPGTLRTALFSSLLCSLIALPILLTNEAVMGKLLEAAAASLAAARF